ncbi:MAG: DsbA family oxidoreductase [Polyangiaceae bacterium]
MSKLRIDVWSDIACPWCFVGKRRLEGALERFPHAEQVEVVWHSFELDSSAPREVDTTQSHAERLAKKYGMSVAQAQSRTEQLQQTARTAGIEFDFEHIRPGNTFDAHRLVHLAEKLGLQGVMKERFLLAYLSEGEAIGDPRVLQRLAVQAGLPAAEVERVLASDAYAAEVRSDEQQARELGINGVPFFVFDQRLAASGAQPVEVLLGALNQAWNERKPEPVVFAEGAVCGPDGC